MNGVSNVSTNTTANSVDIDFDDSLVSVPEMKAELDGRYYYVAYVNISAQQAKTLMDAQPAAITVDVREKSEYCEGHIPEAVLSPWDSGHFQQNYQTTMPSNSTVILVCRSGNRSAQAADFIYDNYFSLARNGIVYNIQTGMNSWNYPVDKCPLPPPPVPGTAVPQTWLNLLLQN